MKSKYTFLHFISVALLFFSLSSVATLLLLSADNNNNNNDNVSNDHLAPSVVDISRVDLAPEREAIRNEERQPLLSSADMKSLDFYRGMSRKRKPPQLTCAQVLHAVHRGPLLPLGRGFIKEVEIASFNSHDVEGDDVDDGIGRGRNRSVTRLAVPIDFVDYGPQEPYPTSFPFVVKRPVAGADAEFYEQMLTKEIDLARQLRVQDSLMQFFGGCRASTGGKGNGKRPGTGGASVLAVEGPLASWDAVVNEGRITLTMRVRIASSLLDLLGLMERKRLVHCDWKPDQVGVSVGGRVKLVDFKSLRIYSPGHGVDRDKNCSGGAPLDTSLPGGRLPACVQASSCFLWQYENGFPVPDAACTPAGHCTGYDSKSMLYNSVYPFLVPLLTRASSGTTPATMDLVRTFLDALAKPLRRKRPESVSDAQRLLLSLFPDQPPDPHTDFPGPIMTAIIQDHVESSALRCNKARYC